MAGELQFEPMDDTPSCACCVGSAPIFGFVYDDGEPYAVYCAGWSGPAAVPHLRLKGAPALRLILGVAVGRWDDRSEAEDRRAISFLCSLRGSEPVFEPTDPHPSWAAFADVGHELTATEALADAALADIRRVAVEAWHADPRLVAIAGMTSPVPRFNATPVVETSVTGLR